MRIFTKVSYSGCIWCSSVTASCDAEKRCFLVWPQLRLNHCLWRLKRACLWMMTSLRYPQWDQFTRNNSSKTTKFIMTEISVKNDWNLNKVADCRWPKVNGKGIKSKEYAFGSIVRMIEFLALIPSWNFEKRSLGLFSLLSVGGFYC